MSSKEKDKKAVLDGGIGKFVQLTGEESDEEVEQIVEKLAKASGFRSNSNVQTDNEKTGSVVSGYLESQEGVAELARAHEIEPSMFVTSATRSLKLQVKNQPSADHEWARLTDDLAHCLANLVEDDYLVLSFKRGWYYVQFTAQGQFGMRAEASSNAYIMLPDARLSTEAYKVMHQLGWRMPTVLPERHDPDGSPNFFLDWANPVDFKSLSELTVRTFRQVFGISHPGQLQYVAFTSTGTKIRLPNLRLKRAE